MKTFLVDKIRCIKQRRFILGESFLILAIISISLTGLGAGKVPLWAVSSKDWNSSPPVTTIDFFDAEVIKNRMRKVFEYTVANPNAKHFAGWERGAFYAGVMSAYKVTGENKYLELAKKWADEAEWKLDGNKKSFTNADSQACAQTYLEIYMLEGGKEKIAHTRKILDKMAEDMPNGRKLWSWCDALFMAPPVFVRMADAVKEEKYNKMLNTWWWDTYDFLYDKEDHLFYRGSKFFNRKAKNGNKEFWSRGNGWVLAGLARVLQYLPKDNERRQDYLNVFREMANKIGSLQGNDGMWRSSLLDPKEFPMPESSGTGFFTFAMMWGVNEGILNRDTFLPIIKKSWTGLNYATTHAGRVSWTQTVAAKPGPVASDAMREYSSGAYLLAGSEILRIVKQEGIKAFSCLDGK